MHAKTHIFITAWLPVLYALIVSMLVSGPASAATLVFNEQSGPSKLSLPLAAGKHTLKLTCIVTSSGRSRGPEVKLSVDGRKYRGTLESRRPGARRSGVQFRALKVINKSVLRLPRKTRSCKLTTTGKLTSSPLPPTATPTSSNPNSTPTPSISNPRQILRKEDFTYLGSYPMRGGDDVYGQGLTHRYVNGELRFIYLSFAGNNNPPNSYLPVEASLPAQFGQTVLVRRDLNTWNSFWDPRYWNNNLCYTSLWWDEQNQRIWSASAFDYPQGGVTTSETVVLSTRKLPANGGTCEEYSGFFGFEGIGQRALYGKVQRVPKWFRDTYATGEYVSLSGGYTSLLAQGLGPALGPMFVFFPALHGNYSPRNGFGDPFNVPAKDFKIGADLRSGSTTSDWYAGGYATRTKERGVRVTPVENYFDGGDPRPNPPTRPSDPPLATAGWLSPPNVNVPGDPNGWGRWVWGDTYGDTGNWSDNDQGDRPRHGILMVASLSKGKAYYSTSSLHSDNGALEIHVYDPADVAAVVAGALPAFKIRPVTVFALDELTSFIQSKNSVGATFDPVTNKLYIMTYFGSQNINYLHEFSVATG